MISTGSFVFWLHFSPRPVRKAAEMIQLFVHFRLCFIWWFSFVFFCFYFCPAPAHLPTERWNKTAAQLTDAARDRNDNNKEEESSGKTLMELLELEMRARAIKALLKRQEADDEAAQHLSTRDNRISSSSSSGSSSGDASSSSRSSSPNGGQNPAVRGGLDTPHGDGGHKSAANPAVKRTADDQDHPPAEKPNQQVELPAADSPPAQHQVDEEFGILDVDIELGVDDDL